jgi:hypothetical protein
MAIQATYGRISASRLGAVLQRRFSAEPHPQEPGEPGRSKAIEKFRPPWADREHVNPGRAVEIRADADPIELRRDGRPVGEHRRNFMRDQTVFDPWHYVPVLARNPDALRNGARLKEGALPAGLERIRRKVACAADGDRQMVGILIAALRYALLRIQRGSRQSMNLHGIFAGGGAEGGAVSSPLIKPTASRQAANATQAATRAADAKPAP